MCTASVPSPAGAVAPRGPYAIWPRIAARPHLTFQADNPQDPLVLARHIDVHLAETRRTADSAGGGARYSGDG
ncbi:hypothetical protein [Streptomyces sp. NPDC048623]|uniref:hypothetical protein n=1 Tax=Streptomyces sp. NPDC048623 TaxID=3155761 RepID=UPI00341BD528